MEEALLNAETEAKKAAEAKKIAEEATEAYQAQEQITVKAKEEAQLAKKQLEDGKAEIEEILQKLDEALKAKKEIETKLRKKNATPETKTGNTQTEEIETQEKKLLSKIDKLNSEINYLKEEIRDKNNTQKNINKKLQDCEKALQEYQRDLQECQDKLSEKTSGAKLISSTLGQEDFYDIRNVNVAPRMAEQREGEERQKSIREVKKIYSDAKQILSAPTKSRRSKSYETPSMQYAANDPNLQESAWSKSANTIGDQFGSLNEHPPSTKGIAADTVNETPDRKAAWA